MQGWVPPTELGGFKKGDRVQWMGSDDDIPEGTVGTVVGFDFSDDTVEVEFPKVTAWFPADELRPEVNARCCQSYNVKS